MKEGFIPRQAVIQKVIRENDQIKTFRLELLNKTSPFTFNPGQFLMLSVPHCGEAAISISSSHRPQSSHCGRRYRPGTNERGD